MDYCQRLASIDAVGCALRGLSSPSERGMSIAGPSDDSKTIPAERLVHRRSGRTGSTGLDALT
jgi:hypothetical protein